ncbi:MAG: hypothetical protein OXU69_07970 [Gemmatimonadota bacterium]|nr:hypothetical protein [Gemmatimonadota bacterium]MDE2984628.1 hypothetical protein [Gemmatimonadota bacterium]
MTSTHRPRAATTATRCTLLAVIVLTAAACASAVPVLRDPRRLVIHSGERLTPTRERMEEIDVWVTEQWDSINLDPSFWIIHGPQEGPVYLWETLEVNEPADTAHINYQDRTGIPGVYLVYAHLHLMAAQDRLDRWLPEADGGTRYEIEKAILSRVADAWLYQRSIFDARPYDLLEELIYSKENDYLDAYILTARPDEFVDARRVWMEENPDGRDAFVAWFRRVFERDPPGVRGATGER